MTNHSNRLTHSNLLALHVCYYFQQLLKIYNFFLFTVRYEALMLVIKGWTEHSVNRNLSILRMLSIIGKEWIEVANNTKNAEESFDLAKSVRLLQQFYKIFYYYFALQPICT